MGARVATKQSQAAGEPFRVLVIDDDPGVRDYMEALVSRQGYRVFAVADAEQALDGLDRTRPDIVTLDVVLPGIDGLETLRRLKQRIPDVPVVMLSGHGQARNIVEAMRLGASDFLRKPFPEGAREARPQAGGGAAARKGPLRDRAAAALR
jgi:DNA-binding NtrC family response regulator